MKKIVARLLQVHLLDYPNHSRAVEQEGEFLFGDDLLMAPEMEQGKREQAVYLPRGECFNYRQGAILRDRLTANDQPNSLTLSVSARQGTYTPPARAMQFAVHHQRTRPQNVTLNSQGLARVDSKAALKDASRGWFYDDESDILWIRFPDRTAASTVQIEK